MILEQDAQVAPLHRRFKHSHECRRAQCWRDAGETSGPDVRAGSEVPFDICVERAPLGERASTRRSVTTNVAGALGARSEGGPGGTSYGFSEGCLKALCSAALFQVS